MKIHAQCTLIALLGALGGGAVPLACSTPDSSARVNPIGPDATQFKAVAPMLVRRCGSIDCHGSRFRNMRVYGYGGLRLGSNRPDRPERVTEEEARATFESVIGLEPELMRDVVSSGGANPERLTLLRKGRNEENHKGDRQLVRDDDADRCLTSWLANKVEEGACNRAGCVDGGVIVPTGCEGPL
jgi:hypothetical protein